MKMLQKLRWNKYISCVSSFFLILNLKYSDYVYHYNILVFFLLKPPGLYFKTRWSTKVTRQGMGGTESFEGYIRIAIRFHNYSILQSYSSQPATLKNTKLNVS